MSSSVDAGINLALTILLGDKIGASGVAAISKVIKDVHDKVITVEDARNAIRRKENDSLDQAIAAAKKEAE